MSVDLKEELDLIRIYIKNIFWGIQYAIADMQKHT